MEASVHALVCIALKGGEAPTFLGAIVAECSAYGKRRICETYALHRRDADASLVVAYREIEAHVNEEIC